MCPWSHFDVNFQFDLKLDLTFSSLLSRRDLSTETASAERRRSVGGSPTMLLAGLRAQLSLARELFSDPRFRAPLLVIWVAVFGAALHEAV